MTRLDGDVAIVTGAGRGIGREIALALAKAGAAVGLFARSVNELDQTAAQIAAGGGKAFACPVDLVDLPAVAGAVERVQAALGPVGLLINNAGSFRAIGPIWAVEPEEWWRDIEINARGTFNGCRAVVAGMMARGRGRIVNMVGGGTATSFPNGSGYALSKAGIMRFTECLDDTLKGSGVLAIAMDPGLVRTTMTEHQLASAAGRTYLPNIAQRFEQGADVSPALAARLSVEIGRGRFDRLRGRLVKAVDDLDAVEAAADVIVDRDLRALRVTGV